VGLMYTAMCDTLHNSPSLYSPPSPLLPAARPGGLHRRADIHCHVWCPRIPSPFQSVFPCSRCAQVAFIAGLMYTAVGLLRLGWITNFLSHTTISGFMSGACIVIALSQASL
jgi:hypothetical protein